MPRPRPRPRHQGSRLRPRPRQYTSRPRPRHEAVASEICEIPRNSLKIQVQGHPRSSILVSVESAYASDFLLVINSNFRRISCSFRDIDTFSYKIACFPHPTIVWRRLAEERLALYIIYTSLKSTFSRLQFCRRHYGSIFIHLAIAAFQNRKITRNSDKMWPYSSWSSKAIDLGVDRKLICDFHFLLVINSNVGPICYCFRDNWCLKLDNGWIFPLHPCLRPSSGELLRMSGWNLASEN